jgi:hypothetical protein
MCGAIDSLQLTAKHNVATSVSWKGRRGRNRGRLGSQSRSISGRNCEVAPFCFAKQARQVKLTKYRHYHGMFISGLPRRQP